MSLRPTRSRLFMPTEEYLVREAYAKEASGCVCHWKGGLRLRSGCCQSDPGHARSRAVGE
jgi:hypothetical protein